jgi:hypothetical protein
MYALYEQITKGYARRISTFFDYQSALDYMQDGAWLYGPMFIEKIGA